ncbi:hypothetical protein KIPB_016330, partial [Kipferlia bialata]|eukprot:g16330.t1
MFASPPKSPIMPVESLAHLDGTFFGATGPTSDTVFSPWSLLHTLLIL